jgi:NosR/NirI family nitrous oxide reductase transcriptional regulator
MSSTEGEKFILSLVAARTVMTQTPNDAPRSQPAPAVNAQLARARTVQRKRVVAVLSIILAAAAWLIGYTTAGADVAPLVADVLPGADRIVPTGTLFVGTRSSDGGLIGYAAVGSAPGYGGPIEVLVGVNANGDILGVKVVQQRETPGFFRRLDEEQFFDQYAGAAIDQPLQLKDDLDGVSGATLSSEGVAAGIRQAVRVIAQEGLSRPLPPEQKPIQFGAPEIVLILLFAAGYFGHRLNNSQWKRRIRWGTLLTGMIFVGFVYTAPLTIAQVAALISGYWPDWHNNLYWYLLIGGILFVTTTQSKNPYCYWFCPFGAFQECLAALTGAKPYRPRRLSDALKWVQRGLAFLAVLLGLVLRRPGVATFEPFATLFDLSGTTVQWILLIVVVLASLIIYRPFCSYLCPLDPVVDFIGELRRWVREVGQRWRMRPAKH